jgi:alpha-galactosidase
VRLGAALASLLAPLGVGCGGDNTDLLGPAASPQAPDIEVLENEPGPSEPLAQTPPMGFNNWNAFGCDVNETLIKETADFFASSGLKDAGYEYVNIDDCWSLMERDADGKLVPDPVKFPSGIRGVADYVHGLGLKLGIYGDAGTRTCAGYPGSLGTEELDAQTWASWGVDYVKYDNCYNQSDGSREDFVRRYTAMRLALEKTGRPILYSICEWGQSQPWEWATEVGHMWRTTGDITDNWSSIRDIIAFNAPLFSYAGPGHWNDPDMLEIGNGELSTIEKRTHMSMWSMMAAPLIIGTDLRIATEETLSVLRNAELIAINQDSLGKQAAVVSNAAGLMVLSKPLGSGEIAVALYNSTDAQALVSVPAAEVGLAASDAYYLHDVWSGSALETQRVIAAGVPAHGSVVLRTRPLQGSDLVPPAVSVEGALATLIPGVPEPVTLTTRVTNRGVDAASQVTVSVQAPDGWTVTATNATSAELLGTDVSLETAWGVLVPEGASAGLYPIAVTATYVWGGQAPSASSATEITGAVAVAPPDGATHLSTLLTVSSSNGLGPMEIDTSNGVEAEGDGNLITIGGKVYTRGLGTHAPSRAVFYLGGRCSQLTVDVGIDDEVSEGEASFSILADGMIVSESGVVTANDAARTLSADLTGANLVELVTDSGLAPVGDHADWAQPQINCGGSSVPTSTEQTLYSFETGLEEFTLANEVGGSLALSTAFATDGVQGLEVTSPADGNWFGRRYAAPRDLSAFTTLRYDVKTTVIGTPGEFALEIGPDSAWCQGGLWTWTNASSSKTIERRFTEIECPEGVTMDLTQVRGIWVYLKDGTFTIDNLRAE